MTPLPERGHAWSAPSVIAAAVVILAASLPYLSTINDYFLQDDFGVIQLMSSRSWRMFFRWFTMPWMENIWMYTPDEIRPFVALSYVMTAAFGAGSPAAHHVLNIAIHAGNGLLVMGIARACAGLDRTTAAGPDRLMAAGLDRLMAMFAAVVFVVLPMQAESVAWVTGRVDSMPTFFYLAAFLAYVRWRDGSRAAYIWSLVWFFVALFCKQNTITMPAALLAYDFIILRRPLRPSWAWLRPYVPFVLMTIGFLWLRYAVVGTVVRESQLNAEGFRFFFGVVAHHTQRVVFGHLAAVWPIEWAAVSAFVMAAAFALTRLETSRRRRAASAAIFFGIVWWALGIAPIAVAGYESPRHVYLAAAGWAVLLAIGLRAIAEAGPGRIRKYSTMIAAAAIVVVYSVQLWTVVAQWSKSADISEKAVAHLEREAMATAPGSLVIVGVPISIWEWAAPFMAQPPYTGSDLTKRVHLITPRRLHCCGAQWLDYTRTRLREWAARPSPSPVVALYVNPRTGAVSRLTDGDYPALRPIVTALIQIDTLDALDRAILRMLEDLVGARPAG